jgi:outer membrane receptor protein involved in Fe transport
LNAAIGSFRNSWTADRANGAANGSFGVSIGGEDPIAGQRIGYVGSLTYSTGQEVRRGERRAVINPGTAPGTFDPQNEYSGQTGRQSVLWGGILNLSTRIGSGTKLSFNNTLTRSADNEATELVGFNDGFAVNLDQTRVTYTVRSARSNQVAGQHRLGEHNTVDWSTTLSTVTRSEPDRFDLAYITTPDPTSGKPVPTEWFGSPRSALRTFGDLDEHAYEGAVNFSRTMGSAANPVTLRVGGLGRAADRDAISVPFDISNVSLTQAERTATPGQLFDGTYASQGRLALSINQLGGRYRAEDRLAAGYAMADLPLSGRIRLVGGARVESSQIKIRSSQPATADIFSTLSNTDILPALALNASLTDNQNLRLSATQTLSRPEYRELAPVRYIAEPLGGKVVRGNEDLQRALVQNLDLRWELYPRAGEVISVAGFYKHFRRPIERVLVQTSDGNAPDATFQNARSAQNYGVELEVRKRLDAIGLRPLTLFANTTLIRSRIKVDTADGSSLTNKNRPMVGQAGYVVNAGVEFLTSGGFSVTGLYNVTGRRIFEAGILPLPDAYEEARHLVDVSVRIPILATMTAKLDAKNLLNEPYRITQGGLDQLRYTTGRIFAAGLTWTP